MNQRNYQQELTKIIEEEGQDKPRLLLHACCAPCSSSVLEYISSYFDITLYFYNPNISTKEEHDKREAELIRLVKEMGLSDRIDVVAPEYRHEDFLEMAKGMEMEPERGSRCLLCYRQRLESAATFASAGNYDYFCTTLTLSPLKSAQALNKISEEMGEKYGVKSLPSDFKKRGGYQRSIELSKQYDLYRQNFCGCEFSKRDSKV